MRERPHFRPVATKRFHFLISGSRYIDKPHGRKPGIRTTCRPFRAGRHFECIDGLHCAVRKRTAGGQDRARYNTMVGIEVVGMMRVDSVGTKLRYDRFNSLNDFEYRHSIKSLIGQAQKDWRRTTESRRRRSRGILPGRYATCQLPPRRLAVGDENGTDSVAVRCMAGKRSTDSQNLVVGMRRNNKNSCHHRPLFLRIGFVGSDRRHGQ